MLIFLHGSDTFRLHERLMTLRQGFVQKYDINQASIETVAASDLTADTLAAKLHSAGLFTKKRCIVITDIFALKADTIPPSDADTIVIITASELPKEDSTLKTSVLAAERVEEFAELTGAQLVHWVNQRVRQAGGTIEPAALNYIIQALGRDTWRMANVITQLVNYQTVITLATVELFVQSPLDENIFHFTDALSARQTGQALRLLHDQLETGANAFYLLTMLARQITILIQVKAGGAAAAKIHPYVQKQVGRMADRFGAEQLVNAYQMVVAADLKLKTTRLTPVVVLDKLVVELTV
ncbi:MAG: DNA polymerase III subunit delta [Patescibacteria group bacterium]|jgi:DNA polymerase-3 subunit delta